MTKIDTMLPRNIPAIPKTGPRKSEVAKPAKKLFI
jgi:hypothetical protein